MEKINTSAKLANRFREVILDGIWISNTNYKNELDKLNWKFAIVEIQNLNSIANIAQHVHYYINGIKNVLIGGNLEIKDKFSYDFPTIDSQEKWEKFLANFWNDSEEFARLIEKLPENKLYDVFVDNKYGTYLRNIDGMIEHSYYHLGQIVLLKKIINQTS